MSTKHTNGFGNPCGGCEEWDIEHGLHAVTLGMWRDAETELDHLRDVNKELVEALENSLAAGLPEIVARSARTALAKARGE